MAAALGHHTDIEGLRQEDLSHHGIVEVVVGQRSLELGHGNEDPLQDQVDHHDHHGSRGHDT